MWVTEVGHVGTGYKCSCSQPAPGCVSLTESQCHVGMCPGAALASHNASRIHFILAVFVVVVGLAGRQTSAGRCFYNYKGWKWHKQNSLVTGGLSANRISWCHPLCGRQSYDM